MFLQVAMGDHPYKLLYGEDRSVLIPSQIPCSFLFWLLVLSTTICCQ